jgi:hypothetical protein
MERVTSLSTRLRDERSFVEVMSSWVDDRLSFSLSESRLVERALPFGSGPLAVSDERLVARRGYLRSGRLGMPVAELFSTVALDRVSGAVAEELLRQGSSTMGRDADTVVTPLGALLREHHPDVTRSASVVVASRSDAGGHWQCLAVASVLSVPSLGDVPVATTMEYVYCDAVNYGSF